MVDDQLRYDRMVERALRGVVRDALAHIAAHGLPGEHHFYLTFATNYAGVEIPPYLRQRYPDEMTIVIQYQFHDLDVTEDGFSVTLSFSGVPERITVPFSAISTFADPSVNFALQFQALPVQERDLPSGSDSDQAQPVGAAIDRDGEESASGKVITLDSFRKK